MLMAETIRQETGSANPTPNPNSPWLSDVSPRHAAWDERKAKTNRVADIYLSAPDLERVGVKLRECSGVVTLTETVKTDTGETDYTAKASRCRGRTCPICSPLRASKLKREIEPAIQQVMNLHPSGRWLFVTLTVKNPPITELRATIKAMNEAWQRLIKRKEFAIVKGWIRNIEVTRGADGSAHPHYHCLLFVPKHYFTGQYYLSHEKWVKLWRTAARLDYDPSVNVQTVKTVDGGIDEVIKAASYSISEAEIQNDNAWFLEYHRQCYNLRFFAAGGLVKEFLKADATEDEDLAGADDGQKETGKKISFEYFRPARKYKRFALRPVS
jgi:plasmid rolling circle replication initiator protein Rep